MASGSLKPAKNGGVIVSIDGIQPDKGNETVYVGRSALTGRVLTAENVISSETEVMKQRNGSSEDVDFRQ